MRATIASIMFAFAMVGCGPAETPTQSAAEPSSAAPPVAYRTLADDGRLVIDFECPNASPDCAASTIAKAEADAIGSGKSGEMLVNVKGPDLANYQLVGVIAPSGQPVLDRYQWNGGGVTGRSAVATWCLANDPDAPLCNSLAADASVCTALVEGDLKRFCETR